MTVEEVVKAALKILGLFPTGYTITHEEIADGLDALNRMLRAWAAEPLLVGPRVLESFPLTAGIAAYTIGSGGDFDTTRPTGERPVTTAFIRLSDIDYPIEPITREGYLLIAAKSVTGLPDRLYYSDTQPGATIYLYPTPSTAYTLWLDTKKGFDTYATKDDALLLPERYDDLLVYQLAIRLASGYGKQVPYEVSAEARRLMTRAKAINAPQVEAKRDPLMSSGGDFSINTGGFIR